MSRPEWLKGVDLDGLVKSEVPAPDDAPWWVDKDALIGWMNLPDGDNTPLYVYWWDEKAGEVGRDTWDPPPTRKQRIGVASEILEAMAMGEQDS